MNFKKLILSIIILITIICNAQEQKIWEGDLLTKDLKDFKAKGIMFNDGIIRIANYAIYGITHQPDLANQIHLIKSNENLEIKPNNSHLEASIGLFTVSNLFTIQNTIKKMFNDE